MHRRSLLQSALVTALTTTAGGAASAAAPPTLGLMGGQIQGTYMHAATDLATALNSDALRIVPVVGQGSLDNIGDLLHLKGVDLAFVNADTLLYAQQNRLYMGELQKLTYICKLYDDDVHIFARPEIKSLADLNGKPVNIDVSGAGSNLTSRMVFKYSGVAPEFRTEEQRTARLRLQRGEIAAMVYVSGKPISLFSNEPADTGLHFLNVPLNENLAQMYVPGGTITKADYPTIVPDGRTIRTIGVGVTLAAYNWDPGSERYKILARFVDAFFSKFNDLLQEPYHPVWRQVNLRAEQPGWSRFKPAAEWLAQHDNPAPVMEGSMERARFDAYLAQHGAGQMTPAEREVAWKYVQQRLQNGQSTLAQRMP